MDQGSVHGPVDLHKIQSNETLQHRTIGLDLSKCAPHERFPAVELKQGEQGQHSRGYAVKIENVWNGAGTTVGKASLWVGALLELALQQLLSDCCPEEPD